MSTKKVLNLTFDHKVKNTGGAMGLTPEQTSNIKKSLDAYLEENGKGGCAQTEIIEWVNNTFETDAEVAYGLFLIIGEEQNLAMRTAMEELGGGFPGI